MSQEDEDGSDFQTRWTDPHELGTSTEYTGATGLLWVDSIGPGRSGEGSGLNEGKGPRSHVFVNPPDTRGSGAD